MSFYSNLPGNQNDTSITSSLYPTIFEILSSQEIDSLLPASVRYILTNYWISRHPSRFTLNVNKYFQEWFDLVLKGSIEWYHITRYNSTFVDKFYGLQRFNCSNKVLVRAQAHSSAAGTSKSWSNGLKLTTKQQIVVFLQKIIIPYVNHKLDELHSKYIAQSTFTNTDDTNFKRWIIETAYPILRKLCYLINLLTRLCFLSGKVGSITFIDYLFDIEYTRLTLPLQPSSSRQNPNLMKPNRLKRQNFYTLWDQCTRIFAKFGNISAYAGSQVFPAFIFMLRVYQWWTTQDLTAKLQRKLNDVDKDIPRANNIESEKYESTDICPICHEKIQNPCVLETGFITCYPCAIEYLPNNEGKCPVTGKRLLGCKYDRNLGKWKVITGVRRILI